MKLKQITFITAALLIVACGKQVKKPATIAQGETGFDATRMQGIIDELQRERVNVHSVLVERRGKLIAEYYGAGSDRTMMKRYGMGLPFSGDIDFDADKLHDVRSVSKSVVSLLYGIERGKEKVPRPEEAVLPAYPALAELATSEKNKITFAHLLSMSSGLEWHEWGRSFITSDETRLLWKSDLARYVFDKPLEAEPGSRFLYSGGSTAVLADTIARGTGKTLQEVVREELFNPMGIGEWEWATDSDERPLAFAGLRLKPRDMVKLGRLVLQKGRWEGKQLIPAAWIEVSTREQVKTQTDFFSGQGEKLGYGYQWWVGKSPWQASQVEWTCAVGNGGQRICAVPQLNLVIVTTAGDYGDVAIQRRIAKLVDAIISTIK